MQKKGAVSDMKKKNGFRKAIHSGIAFFLAVFLCLGCPGAVLAADSKTGGGTASSFTEEKAAISILEDQLAILQRNSETALQGYDKAVAAYDEAQLDVKRAQQVKEALDREVGALEAEIDTSRKLLDIYEAELAALDEEIAAKETEIEERQITFVARIRNNYEDSFTSYLEILLSSQSFADFLYRLDVVASLLDYDKRVLKSLNDAKNDLETLQTDKLQMQRSQQKTYESLTAKLPALEQKVAESETAIENYNLALKEALERKETSDEERAAAAAALEAAQKELDDAEEALAQKIREEQDRLRREAEEKARREAEERAKREAEEKARREEEERQKKESGEQSDAPGEDDPPVTEGPGDKPGPTGTGGGQGSVYGEPVIDQYVGGTFRWPVDTRYAVISSPFCYRPNPFTGRQELHNGIDIPCDYGAAIYAGNDGTVIVATYHYSYGNYVVIDHGGGVSTLYAHNSQLLVSVGDTVTRGQQIAKAGSTGDSQGNHCHFSVRVDGYPTDPLNGYITKP